MKFNPYHIIRDNARGFLKRLSPSVIVCHELRLLYFSIPKTASSSMKRYLRKHGFEKGRRDLDDMSSKQIQVYNFPRIGHSEAALLRKQGYKSIVIVRNPFDRIRSCYTDKILKRKNNGIIMYPGFERYNLLFRKKLFHIDMSFDEFISSVSKVPDLIADGHFRTQTRYLWKAGGEADVDHMIDISDLDKEMMEITARMNIAPWESRRSNPSSSNTKDFSTSAGSVEFIRKRYRSDFRILHYDPNVIPWT